MAFGFLRDFYLIHEKSIEIMYIYIFYEYVKEYNKIYT